MIEIQNGAEFEQQSEDASEMISCILVREKHKQIAQEIIGRLSR